MVKRDKCEFVGQDFVRHISEETMRMVEVSHTQGLPYVSVDLRNQAKAEASATRDYSGRYLFELVQNANDAIAVAKDDPAYAQTTPYRVRIELTNAALIIANDGVPFLEKDVDSIYRWGQSSKDPNKSIGYKGIGFKSVLEITDRPEIYSRVVQFRFDRNTCYRKVQQIVGSGDDLLLPTTRFVFPYSPGSVGSINDRALIKDLLDEQGFATVIRLPFQSGAPENVLERIQLDLDPALLLFLNGIDEIEVHVRGNLHRRLWRQINGDRGSLAQDVTLYDGNTPVSRWLLFNAPKRRVDAHAAKGELHDEAWERVKSVGYALAFPLDDDGRLEINQDTASKLYVYFPTNEDTGLRYRVHGDFYINAARKRIEDVTYNRWMARQIAIFLRASVVPQLIALFPDDDRVVRMLTPYNEGNLDLLRQAIVDELKACKFVPTVAHDYRTPGGVMLSPVGADVDIDAFQKFFPSIAVATQSGDRQFLIPLLERVAQVTAFLESLGAKRLSFSDVFACFNRCDTIQEAAELQALYEFLWRWYGDVPYGQRDSFSAALRNTRCIFAGNGTWIKPYDRLYHAKLRQETPFMPRVIKADLVHPAVYGEEGRAGATYKLFDTFKPPLRDYDAPDIISNAVLPLFEQGRFQSLSLEERAEVYRYLFEYWCSRRGAGDPEVERHKARVQVPARPITNRRRDEWREVGQVYLSSDWTKDERLEKLYEGMPDIVFLYDVRGLDIAPEEQNEWAKFWVWLGAAVAPRLLVDEVTIATLATERWRKVKRKHPHAGTQLWLDYVQSIEKYSHCQKHGDGCRQLRRSVALEGFAQFVEQRRADRLALLYELLAEHWDSYRSWGNKLADVFCYRKSCPQYARSEKIPSFYEFLLREVEWIPAQTLVDGDAQVRFYNPTHCWFTSVSEGPLIRNLLPTPLNKSTGTKYRQFSHDIGMRFVEDAPVADWVDLLQILPTYYPDPNITVSSGRRKITGAITTLSRWVMGRLNNLLTQEGSEDAAKSPQTVPLLAEEGGTLRYVDPPETVFFADDRYHAAYWRDHLPFASLDKNWGAVAEFLNIKPISKHVQESCAPGDVLVAESKRLERHFKNVLPFILAVVDEQRESETQDVVRYLTNLRIKVVDTLVVHRQLTIAPGKTLIDDKAKVYLEETSGTRGGSAGRAPRTGVLYVQKSAEQNYDLLATPIAEYIRIPGIADALVILLDRGDKAGWMRYLKTRGLEDKDVTEMRELLASLRWEPPEPVEDVDERLDPRLLNQLLETSKPDQPEPEPEGQLILPMTQAGSVDRTQPEPQSVQFPLVDVGSVRVIPVDAADIAVTGKSSVRASGSGGVGAKPNWESDQRLSEAYGRQGESVVHDVILKQLRDAGVEHPERCLRWLRKEGKETADHDFELKAWVGGEWRDWIIEVKATPARDFRFHMSRQELECAQRAGEQYKLYRVTGVTSAAPQIYVFENPYTLWQKNKAVIELRDTYVMLSDPRAPHKLGLDKE